MISIAIPAYEMQGEGVELLSWCLRQLSWAFDDVIVSDDSGIDDFKELCDVYGYKYVRNIRTKGAAGNLNNAIDHAKYDIIKVLFQDDYYEDDGRELLNINHWSFCTSKHNTNRGDHVPYHPPSLKELALGCNTYGSPSAMAFRRTDLRFDENLQWLFDVDFYVRMTQRYGLPDLLPTFVNITEWDGMATNTVCTGDIRVRESNYMKEKYANL